MLLAIDPPAVGKELWQTDGTSSGTALVQDINPGPTGSYPHDFLQVGGTVFFATNDGGHGTELWGLVPTFSSGGGGGSSGGSTPSGGGAVANPSSPGVTAAQVQQARLDAWLVALGFLDPSLGGLALVGWEQFGALLGSAPAGVQQQLRQEFVIDLLAAYVLGSGFPSG